MGKEVDEERKVVEKKVGTERFLLSQRSFTIVAFILLICIGFALLIFINTEAGSEIAQKLSGFHDTLRSRGWLK